MKRDYYEVLGIPREADLQQIKKAYRRLARELHPDVNTGDPNCEEKFKEATEAYEVLSDQEKRSLYDAYGHEGLRGGAGGFGDFGGFSDIFENIFSTFAGGGFGGSFTGGSARSAGPARGDDLSVEIQLTLEEAAFGVEKEVTFHAQGTCSACEGQGTTNPGSVTTCSECGGQGVVRVVRRTILGQIVQTAPCVRCGGRGQVIKEPCSDCQGAGRRPMERKVTVNIPAGIAAGQRIRVGGRGGAGERGARFGDLYVHVAVAPHEFFERSRDDIFYKISLTMTQAALGCTLTIPTLDGDEEVEFAAGTQPGEQKTLKGKGATRLNGHGRGDEIIKISVLIPHNLDGAQRQLLLEFEDSCANEQYGERSEGVFDRLRSFFRG